MLQIYLLKNLVMFNNLPTFALYFMDGTDSLIQDYVPVFFRKRFFILM